MHRTVHLFHSPLWVNILWRTTLFMEAPQFIDTPVTITTDRLKQCVFPQTFPPSLIEFLIYISDLIDGFIKQVANDKPLAVNLGLCPPFPGQIEFRGYSSPVNARLVTDCLFRCMFLDKVLWAHGLFTCGLVRREHSMTQFDSGQMLHSYDHFLEHVNKMVVSSNVVMDTDFPWSSQTILGNISHITALQASLHDVTSEVHRFLSNMFYAVTGTLYCLEDHSGEKFLHLLQTFQQVHGTTNELPNILVQSIINTFGNFDWTKKKPYTYMWLQSVAFVCSPKFPGADKDASRVQVLQQTAIPVRISKRILSTERAIIRFLIRILGSVFSQVDNQSSQPFHDTLSDPMSGFSTLVMDLNAALSDDGEIDVKTIPFTSIIDGFPVYTFPVLKLPSLFFSIAQSREQSKVTKQIAASIGQNRQQLFLSGDGIHVTSLDTQGPSTPDCTQSLSQPLLSTTMSPTTPFTTPDNSMRTTSSPTSPTSDVIMLDTHTPDHFSPTTPTPSTRMPTTSSLVAPTSTTTSSVDPTSTTSSPATPKSTTPAPMAHKSTSQTPVTSTTSTENAINPLLRSTRLEKNTQPWTGRVKPSWLLRVERKRKREKAQHKRDTQKRAKAVRKAMKRKKDAQAKAAAAKAAADYQFAMQKKKAQAKVQRYLARPPLNKRDYIDLTQMLKDVDFIDLTIENDPDCLFLGHGEKLNGQQTHVIHHEISVWVPYVDPAGEDDLLGRVVFRRETLDIPFTNHSYPFCDLAEWLDLCGMFHNKPPAPAPFCTVISKSKFARLPVQQQRELWRQGNIHIFHDGASNPRSTMPSLYILKHLGVNILQTRSIYENQRATSPEYPRTGIRHGSLSSLFSMSPIDMLDCNVLDIPLPSSKRFLPPECLVNLSLNDELSTIEAPVDMPHHSLQWCLFATPPSRTDIHIDAGKFHTWLQPQNGMKLLMVQEPLAQVEEVDTLQMDERAGKWYGVILRPGDVFLMRANTNHRVVTLQESVTMGGHFYSIDNLERTMLAGLREHIWGDTVTDTTHTRSEAMLYRFASFLEEIIASVNQTAALLTNEERDRFSVPDELESHILPPLIFMLLYPERLTPQADDGTRDRGPISSDVKALRELSRNLAFRILKMRPHISPQVSDLNSRKLFGQTRKTNKQTNK